MEVVGSEIGQKMRSAIKAKLTELGCYVDDELPDYVMVMVANKRTRTQMEEDLQLFLGDNTQLFVNWLHQVLKKLQEVTVTPLKAAESEKAIERTKEKKLKTKKAKEKIKKTDSKKAKKKDKEKSRRKEEKKAHKSKKKSKKHEMIRPNIPPLLMNMEKESEPSITDVFAGQILKNHGITLEMSVLPLQKEENVDMKPVIMEKRPILPIIDPATILSHPEEQITPVVSQSNIINIEEKDSTPQNDPIPITPIETPRENQVEEMNKIEAKIQGLKQKLAEQLDSMSEDEDFLNIRTEAEELMNDFAEDVFQEISSQAPPNITESTPPPKPTETLGTPKGIPSAPKEAPIDIPKELPETIELKLPKRPIRERLGTRENAVKLLEKTRLPEKKKSSPERFTPEPEPDFWGKSKCSAKDRLGAQPEKKRSSFSSDSSDGAEKDKGRKRITSSSSERPAHSGRAKCASVVVVKPRMRPQTSSLLLRAVADAHKSLLNIPPPKGDMEPHNVKRALVLPMRRRVEHHKIVVQMPRQTDKAADCDHDKSRLTLETEKAAEYVPLPLSRKFTNPDYVPSRRDITARLGEPPVIEAIDIHHLTEGKDKSTQFIVTMDGFNPNAFLAKKLMSEGILNDDDLTENPKTASVLKTITTDKANLNDDDLIENPKTASVLKTITTDKAKDEELREEKKSNEDENVSLTSITIEEKHDIATEKTDTNENKETSQAQEKTSEIINKTPIEIDIRNIKKEVEEDTNSSSCLQNKRLSRTSENSDTPVVIKQEKVCTENAEKRKPDVESLQRQESPPEKKRKASPIVFDMGKNEREKKKVREKERKEEERLKETKRERTESADSDKQVIVTTLVNPNKYETLPSLSVAEHKPVWCRAFPSCRYGAACAFQHPRCRFAAACTRRNCPYSHDLGPKPIATPAPIVASHVVPVANYKSISPGVLPNICRFYPNCTSVACRYYHPKPCRFGAGCTNKLECNFYHSDGKWNHAV